MDWSILLEKSEYALALEKNSDFFFQRFLSEAIKNIGKN